MLAESTNAGRRPACSLPLTGSNSTHAISPTSGSIFLFPTVVERDLTARIRIVNNLSADVGAPINCLGLVFRSKSLHLGDQFHQPVMLNRQWPPDTQVTTLDFEIDLGPCSQPNRF